MEECVFCKMSNGEIPTEKISENRNFFSVLDINQKIEGHALVISKKHFKNVLEMPSSLGNELLDCIKSTSEKLTEKYHSSGFNLINNNSESAGQVIHHIHFHILPRKEKDGLNILV